MRNHPSLIEINTGPFLRYLSERHRQPLTLRTIPPAEWTLIKTSGFDLVWLMGLWKRSPGAREQALLSERLRDAYGRALPDWREEDVSGSPYAIPSYRLDAQFGDPGDLSELRKDLNRIGLELIVDFVPNHVALDHPWIHQHPDRFVRGTEDMVRDHPDWFFPVCPDLWLAHGRDPHFPPWTDTAQIDFRSREARRSLIRELLTLTEIADGVRCDMAMLALRDVFDSVWPPVGQPEGESTEFWVEAIAAAKTRRPEFLFIAEAYWGREEDLLRLGFDYTYDKTLYDLLHGGDAAAVRRHLELKAGRLDREVHFIENHDEERAVTVFGPERSCAAAAIISTLPGMRFFHGGQMEGRRIRLPVQLSRQPREPSDPELETFYRRLLAAIDSPVLHDGRWEPAKILPADPDDRSHENLLAWTWRHRDQLRIVVVNFSDRPARGRFHLETEPDRRETSVLRNDLSGTDAEPRRAEAGGVSFDLQPGPWEACLFRPL